MLSPDAKKLQAGLPLLQRPFSEAAGTVIFKRLQTVEAGVPGIRLTDGPQVLERLHPYIQWLASAIQRIGQPSPTTSSSSSGNSQRSMDHHASSSSSRGPSLLISPYVGAMLHCMIHVDDILQATDSEQAKPDNVAVIRDLLVEPQTGKPYTVAAVVDSTTCS